MICPKCKEKTGSNECYSCGIRWNSDDIYEMNFYKLANLISFMYKNDLFPEVLEDLNKISYKIYDKILDNYKDFFDK